MAMVRVKGKKNFKKKLETKQRQITAGSIKGVEEVSEAVRDRAEARAPRDSGDLAKGQQVKTSKGGKHAKIGAFDPKLFYHFWVHEGTGRIKGQPYLDQAAADVRPEAAKTIAAAIRKES